MGWIVQATLGMAFWIAPRFWKPPWRGNVSAAYLAFVLVNGGIWLVVLGTVSGLSRWLLVSGRLLELLAGVGVIAAVWPRIVSRDSHS
jgi:hypothetical protein